MLFIRRAALLSSPLLFLGVCGYTYTCTKQIGSTRGQRTSLSSSSPMQAVSSLLFGKSAPNAPTLQNDRAPSWAELSSMLTQEERAFNAMRDQGRGPYPTPWASIRLFDSTDEKAADRVTLYRDSAAWCPYCEKVWLQLEEKQIPYRVEKVPLRCYGAKPRWFLDICPGGMLPVCKIDGQVITESNDIMQAIEERFPDHKPLLPKPGTEKSSAVGPLLRLERQLFSAWLGWLTSSGPSDRMKAQFVQTMDSVDKALDQFDDGPYFLGDDISLVDLMYTSFLERMAASLPYFKGLVVRGEGRWPNVERWFDAMESRPTFKYIKSDYYTHCQDLPPQVGPCGKLLEGAPFRATIDGQNGAWDWPLKQQDTQMIEPLPKDYNEKQASREAASRLLANHAAVTKFASRGLGSGGFPPVSAPLADPNAQSNEDWTQQVDCALRHVCHALLEGTDAAQQRGLSDLSPPVNEALQYLRLRVGVPRDMTYPAARQLRAHLHWIMASAGKT
ncbi:unnamed protein product [Vitrella brassicaformis CCMP3155]|uniref:GST N-terminal domain-containing protein n=1 Tax=Vitrella brassicaformis (strain CCMP3155) TaxID=1169540 RepID=A0A0G4EGA8_VITBC|nr:unnamed protein product [Vitrella brassicaformis CCMP3155]|eukprot:CEL94417.1 unnamed protein product [Vitrella brassicaformis CCMP3155]